jgi:hypothetical protein
MSALLATDVETTDGKAARYGTVTTQWRQEKPGLWIATRAGNVSGAIYLAVDVENGSAAEFTTLEEARASSRQQAPVTARTRASTTEVPKTFSPRFAPQLLGFLALFVPTWSSS